MSHPPQERQPIQQAQQHRTVKSSASFKARSQTKLFKNKIWAIDCNFEKLIFVDSVSQKNWPKWRTSSWPISVKWFARSWGISSKIKEPTRTQYYMYFCSFNVLLYWTFIFGQILFKCTLRRLDQHSDQFQIGLNSYMHLNKKLNVLPIFSCPVFLLSHEKNTQKTTITLLPISLIYLLNACQS